MLLENGSDKDQPNGMGWTPLHEACYFNHLDTVQLLLVHGADPTIKNVRGGTIVGCAARHLDVVVAVVMGVRCHGIYGVEVVVSVWLDCGKSARHAERRHK